MTTTELIRILREGSRALVWSVRFQIADRLEYLDERVDIMSDGEDPGEPPEITEQMRLV